jgi:hypothetical protein
MVETAETAFFVSAQDERSSAVRTQFVENADATLGISECDEILSHQAHLDWRTVGFSYFFRQTSRHPVVTHDLAHWGIALNLAQQVIFSGGKQV